MKSKYNGSASQDTQKAGHSLFGTRVMKSKVYQDSMPRAQKAGRRNKHQCLLGQLPCHQLR